MFEAAEIKQRISKEEFKSREPELQTALLEVQRTLAEADFPVIVIVSGVEGAGKGEVVNRLNKWLDARGIQTFAFWEQSDEETERPRFWRFWRSLPPRGTIGILFGSWYTRPIIDRVYQNIDEPDFTAELARIAKFEQMLSADGALIVKLWFHLSKEAQKKRLKQEKNDANGPPLSPLTKKFAKHYDTFFSISERAVSVTDTGNCPWHIVHAENRRYRDLTAGNILLAAIHQHLAERDQPSRPATSRAVDKKPTLLATSLLDQVDLSKRLPAVTYRKRLANYQRRLSKLAWQAYQRKRTIVAVFEGWDAAGKGGAIRRFTAAVDARLYRVISIAAPTDEERAQHYLWRFWRHLPRAGHITVYDRSWYGRVLVERVEGFARPAEWSRAYQEINDFEMQLYDSGVIVVKFWLHISPEEQLRRFQEREQTPWKQHKLTQEDWRNREKWGAYETAVNEMIAHTGTLHAPWVIVPGDDKKFARVRVLKTLCNRLESEL